MLSAIQIIKTIILIITGSCGLILNSWIVAVHLSHWKKGVSLGDCDQIILIMGVTNVLLQCLLTFSGINYNFQLNYYLNKEFMYVTYIVLFFLVSLWNWLTAWLAICYCLRLGNISHRIFMRLKKRISSGITQLLLGTVIILGMISIPLFWTTHIKAKQNTTSTFVFKQDMKYLYFISGFGCCLPTLITSLCMGLSLKSLLKHVHRMKQNHSQSWSSKMKTHARACTTIFLLMALNLSFFLTIFIGTIVTSIQNLWDIFFWSIKIVSPSGQALILLFGNSKLWSDLLKTCF
ncbi:taste receptor type 2 member 41-like [Xenopus tropicalis]|uniref:Taste receptor type 2 n=1 Tax=Xenopus tropicalis TaxID=8364 RepID=A0A6I8PJF9_XENTR|nr:taste receptor type 2 member 41-like [Xenopus tropicalis]|eukprot:XP_004918200.1 PREDICTED: taste receptor type 2 member 41-like [Xenopus tropicalis]